MNEEMRDCLTECSLCGHAVIHQLALLTIYATVHHVLQTIER